MPLVVLHMETRRRYAAPVRVRKRPLPPPPSDRQPCVAEAPRNHQAAVIWQLSVMINDLLPSQRARAMGGPPTLPAEMAGTANRRRFDGDGRPVRSPAAFVAYAAKSLPLEKRSEASDQSSPNASPALDSWPAAHAMRSWRWRARRNPCPADPRRSGRRFLHTASTLAPSPRGYRRPT